MLLFMQNAIKTKYLITGSLKMILSSQKILNYI